MYKTLYASNAGGERLFSNVQFI